MQTDLEYQLEQMIDEKGLPAIVGMLLDICDQKASHVEENWQDKNLAKQWQKKSNILYTAKSKLDKFK